MLSRLFAAVFGIVLLLSLSVGVSAASPVSVNSPSPDSLEAGSGSFVSVDVRANENLSAIFVEAIPSSGLDVSGENPVSIGSLEAGESSEASFWFSGKMDASSGLHGVKFRVTGTVVSSGEAFSHSREEALLLSGSTEGLGIDIESPYLEVGGKGKLFVDLSAPVGEEVRDVEVRLVSTEEASPVEVVGARSREVGDLSGGEKERVVFDISADGDGSPGVYGFRVVVDHSSRSVSKEVGIEVEGSPDLVVEGEALPGPEGWVVEGNLSNVGTSSARSVVVMAGGSSDVVGAISPDGSRGFSVEVGGEPGSYVDLNVSFRDSGERESRNVRVPVSSVSPDLSVTEVDVERSGGHLVLSGTVSNRGSSTASGLVVSVGESGGVVPVYPSRSYFVGDLGPGDFASFELTFRTNATFSVPVSLEYRSGGKRDEVRSFSLPEGVSSGQDKGASSIPGSLITGLILVIGAGVVGAVAYSWRG